MTSELEATPVRRPPWEMRAERAARAARVLALRREGRSWKAVAEAVGLSVRQCARLMDDAERDEARRAAADVDPLLLVGRILLAQQTALGVAEHLAETARRPELRLSAARSSARVAALLLETATAVGALPDDPAPWRLLRSGDEVVHVAVEAAARAAGVSVSDVMGAALAYMRETEGGAAVAELAS